jgi:hypothetical protein
MKQHGYSNDVVPKLSTATCTNLPRWRNAAVRIARENKSELYSGFNNMEIGNCVPSPGDVFQYQYFITTLTVLSANMARSLSA